MKMNIYLKELKNYWKSLLFWSVAIVGFMLSAMSKYQGYVKSGTSINDVIGSLPAGLSAVLGFKNLDLQSAGGFYAMCALYLGVMLGVHAVLIGAGIIAKEETDKTIEFLNSNPVSRYRILSSKLLAAFTEVVALNIVTAVSSILVVAAFNQGPSINRDIIFLMPSVFFIQLWFLVIGAAFASIMRRPRRAAMFSAAVLMATFVISAAVDISDRLAFLRYISPFKYFDAKTIFTEGRYETRYIVITLVVVVILLAGSEIAYKRRDFYV